MGTKTFKNDQDVIFVENDCEIIDADITTITIPDSQDNPNETQSDLDVSKELLDTNEDNFLFEVNFKSASIFSEIKDNVLACLRESFKDQSDISIVEEDEAIRAYRIPPEEDMNTSGLFMIDTQPADRVDVVQIPSYKRSIQEILDNTSHKKKKSEDDCERPKQKKSCFNCGEEDHDLRSCPKPRNNSKINKAKKAHSLKHERYHVDIEQRFAHLRPGRISKKLREALGIRSGELPFFFYRMRVMGYPPGWLEDAKVAHSGISLFDSEGRSVRDPEDEDGEIEADKHKYDANKIIAFPGFNSDPGPHFYDDHKYHNVPPLNPEDFRDKFIEMLGANVVKGYKRKKLKNIYGTESTEQSIEISDMEIDENISTANVEFTRPPPPPTPPPTILSPPPLPPAPEEPSPAARRSPSPSLEDLEEKQKKLLQELQSNVSLISEDNDDSLIDDVIQLEVDNKDAMTTPTKADTSETAAADTDNAPSQPQTPQTPVIHAMESVLGTPVLKFSPFDKLPCGDNFKVGVSDVINFENLPDSTGTYEKMKDVIKKVRTVVTQLNSEDS